MKTIKYRKTDRKAEPIKKIPHEHVILQAGMEIGELQIEAYTITDENIQTLNPKSINPVIDILIGENSND